MHSPDETWIAEDGAISSENWQAALLGAPPLDAFEYPLFSDADLEGEVSDGFGPYMILNSLGGTTRSDLRFPAAFLRVQFHITVPFREFITTYDTRYHGGGIQDELAALLSLGFGIRLKAGGATRFFQKSGDPRGRPWSFRLAGQHDPLLITSNYGPVLPTAIKTQRLAVPDQVLKFFSLSQDASNAVVRAARLYQDAIWLADAEPAQAWLLLVAAIETAAVHWRAEEDAPIDRLRTSRPELEQLLESVGGVEHVTDVAAMIAPYMGSTKRFIDFVLHFLPDPPQVRPPEWAQHSWTHREIKKSLGRIYGHRSNALHSGIPFPGPMGWAPRRIGDAFTETPAAGGTGAGVGDNVWVAADIPMLFHLFEYIGRGALLRWWSELLDTSAPVDPAASS